MITKSIMVLGSGGHASVVVDTLKSFTSLDIAGILDINPGCWGLDILGIRILGGEEELLNYPKNELHLVNGIGSTDVPYLRAKIFKQFKKQGYQFYSLAHQTAYIAESARYGEGVQLLAGSYLHPNAILGDNVIVNVRAVVDHDCEIGNHVHVSPGVILSGNVAIGEMSHIGTGAIVIQGVTIGEHCVVGAGAVVLEDVQAGDRVAGVPARKIG